MPTIIKRKGFSEPYTEASRIDGPVTDVNEHLTDDGSAAAPRSSRVLLIKGSAGMGNRILGLLTGVLFAHLSDRRLIVDWSDPLYSPDGHNVFPELFATPKGFRRQVDIPLGFRGTVAPPIWENCLHWTVPQMLRLPEGRTRRQWKWLTANPSQLHYQEDVIVFWSRFERIHEMRPHFRCDFEQFAALTDDEILRSLIRSHLALQPNLAAEVDSFRAQHWGGQVIGIHLRASDRRGRISSILRAADRITAEFSDSRVFLATDNADLLHHARKRYGNARVIATDKWFPEPGKPIHGTNGSVTSLQKAREALIDLHLLSSAQWLLADERSTFAYVARLLFNGPCSRVMNFDPGRFLPRHIGHRVGNWRLALRDNFGGWVGNPE